MNPLPWLPTAWTVWGHCVRTAPVKTSWVQWTPSAVAHDVLATCYYYLSKTCLQNHVCNCTWHHYVHVITMYLNTYVFDKEQSCHEHTENTTCPCKQTEPMSLKPNMHQSCHIFPQSTQLYLFQARLYHEDTARDTKLRRHVPFNKHTNHSQTIKQYRHTLLFASKLCHHVPLKWNTMHTKHAQTMPNVLYLRSICTAPLMFWTWNDTSLATKKLQRTRTSIEMVKVVRHTSYFLHCFQLPLLSSSDPHMTLFLTFFLADLLHSVWHSFWQSFWHFGHLIDMCLRFFLTYLLTFFLTYLLTFFHGVNIRPLLWDPFYLDI